jgi:hypothetical protein
MRNALIEGIGDAIVICAGVVLKSKRKVAAKRRRLALADLTFPSSIRALRHAHRIALQPSHLVEIDNSFPPRRMWQMQSTLL